MRQISVVDSARGATSQGLWRTRHRLSSASMKSCSRSLTQAHGLSENHPNNRDITPLVSKGPQCVPNMFALLHDRDPSVPRSQGQFAQCFWARTWLVPEAQCAGPLWEWGLDCWCGPRRSDLLSGKWGIQLWKQSCQTSWLLSSSKKIPLWEQTEKALQSHGNAPHTAWLKLRTPRGHS